MIWKYHKGGYIWIFLHRFYRFLSKIADCSKIWDTPMFQEFTEYDTYDAYLITVLFPIVFMCFKMNWVLFLDASVSGHSYAKIRFF